MATKRRRATSKASTPPSQLRAAPDLPSPQPAAPPPLDAGVDDEHDQRRHDQSYRKLFEHPELLASLLGDILRVEAADVIDFSRATPIETTFISPALERRESDMLWSLPLKDSPREIVLMLLLEFQSFHDPTMAARVLHYASSLYLRRLTQRVTARRAPPQPPFLAVVLYNGKPRWTAARSFVDLLDIDKCSPLFDIQPQITYHLVDVHRLKLSAQERRSWCTWLFRLEQAKDPHQIESILGQLVAIMDRPELQAVSRSLTAWVLELLKTHDLPLDVSPLAPLHTVHDMVYHGLSGWQERLEKRYARKFERTIAPKLAADFITEQGPKLAADFITEQGPKLAADFITAQGPKLAADFITTQGPKLAAEFKQQIKSTLEQQLTAELKPTVEQKLTAELKPTVEQKLTAELKLTVEQKLTDEIKPTIEQELKQQLAAQIKQQLIDELRPQLIDELKQQLTAQIKAELAQQLKG